MSMISFIAERGNPGSDGTVVDLVGLGLPDRPLVLTTNFDAMQVVASCVASKVPEGLLVEADVPDRLLDYYPAIGFSVEQSEPNEHGGRTVTACTLRSVSLGASPNVDPAIKTLREQIAH